MSSPAGLLEILREKGIPLGPWGDAVASVPRELFLPDEVEVGDEFVSRATSPTRWLEVAHTDVSVTTQVHDGRPTGPEEYRLPTSSSSQPSVMLEMLSLLGVQATDRLLELGSGTGLNAAWLAHRVGSHRVVSVEIDPVLAEQAVKNTPAAGLSPCIVQGDGEHGRPAGAPYQRVIATYAVTAIPYAWVEQVAAPQGRIVAPWGGSFFPYSFAVLDVRDGRAEGRFTGYPAFMRDRTPRPELAIQRIRDEARGLLAELPEGQRPALGWAEGAGRVRALGALYGGRTCGFSLRHGDGWSEWAVRPHLVLPADPEALAAELSAEDMPCGVCALCRHGR